jgi:tetratricopeptide (TPR) repeat protein
MRGTSDVSVVSVVGPCLLRAARELGRAGRWRTALALLDAAATTDPSLRSALAVTAAEVAMDATWFGDDDVAGARIAAADAAQPEGVRGWDLDLVRGRYDYYRLLYATGTLRAGPDGKSPDEVAAARRRFEELLDRAPDAVRLGWAEMYLGLVEDNLYGHRDAAPPHYRAALAAGRSGDDDLLAREALRHLGDHDHDHDHGDYDRALERWREATSLGAGAGNVVGTLSQQLLLAVVARDLGDPAGSVALAAEVARWAAAIGAGRLADRATAFLGGADPTAGPQPPADHG